MADAAARTESPMLEVFGDFVCPFCWLAQPVVHEVAAGLGLPVRFAAFELRPLPGPHPDERYMRRLWEHGVRPIARQLGIEVEFPTLRTRTRKAHEAAAFAGERGRGDALRGAIFDAYFHGRRDIGRIDVLVELGEAVGLDRTELKVALENDQYADAVADDRARADALGVPAVPGFVLHAGGRAVAHIGWCAHSDLRHWLEDTLNLVRA